MTGRKILTITGSVPSNNLVSVPKPQAEMKTLALKGRYVYMCLCGIDNKPFAIHLEFSLPNSQTVRVSISNMFKEENYDNLTIRVPAKLKDNKWTALCLDSKALLEKHSCIKSLKEATLLKTVTICANIKISKIVTSDKIYDPQSFPKELNFKIMGKENWNDKYDWIDLIPIERIIKEPKKLSADNEKTIKPTVPKKEIKKGPADKSIKEQLEEQQNYTLLRAKSEETKTKFLQKVMGKENLQVENKLEDSLRSSASKPMKMEKDNLLSLRSVIGATVRQCVNAVWNKNGDAKEILYASGLVIVGMDINSEAQRIFKGHNDIIKAISISPKADLLASCERTVIKVWNVETARCIATWNADGYEELTNIGISYDSKYLAVSGLDNHKRDILTLWDLHTLEQINAYQPAPVVIARQLSPYQIQAMKFGPDLTTPEGEPEVQLCTCGKENIRFWRLKKHTLKGTSVVLNTYSRDTFFTCLDYEGKAKVYVGSREGRILQVNAETQDLEFVFQLHEAGIKALAVCEAFCVTGSDDMYLRVWPLDFSEFFMEAKHESLVQNVAISPDSVEILCATENSTVGVLDIPNQKYRTLIRSHTDSIIAADTYKNHLVTVSLDKTIRIWDLETRQQVYEFSSPEDQATCVAIHYEKQSFVCGFNSGAIRVFDLQKTSVTEEYMVSDKPISVIRYLSKAHLLVTVAEDGGLTFFNANSHQLIKQVPAEMPSVYTSLAVLGSEQLFATIGGNATSIFVWDTPSLTKIITIPLSGCQVRDIAMRSSNLQLLAVTSDSQLRVFSLDGKALGKFPIMGINLGPLVKNVRLTLTENGKYATLYGFGRNLLEITLPNVTSNLENSSCLIQTQQFASLETEEYLYHTANVNTALYRNIDPKTMITVGGPEGIFMWNFQGDVTPAIEGDLPPEFTMSLRKTIPPPPKKLGQKLKSPEEKKEALSPSENVKQQELIIRESVNVNSSLALPLMVEEEKLSVTSLSHAFLNKENVLIMKKQELMLPSKHYIHSENEPQAIVAKPFLDNEDIIKPSMITGYNGHAHDNIIWDEKFGWVAYTVRNKLIIETVADKNQKIYLEQETDISTSSYSSDKLMFATGAGNVNPMTKKADIYLYNVLNTHENKNDRLTLNKKLASMHETGIQALEFIGNHKFICSIGSYPENVVVLWNCSTGNCVLNEKMKYPINDVKVDFNDETLLSWATIGNHEITIWELTPGTKPKIAKKASETEPTVGTLTCLAQSGYIESENARLFLIGTTDGRVMIYNPKNKKFVGEYPVFEGQISTILFKQKSIIISGTSSTILCWDLPEPATVHPNFFVSKPKTMMLDSHAVSMSFDNMGNEGQVGTDLGTIWYINWSENLSIKLHSGHLGSSIKCIGQSNEAFVTCADDDTVKLWSPITCDQLTAFEIPGVPATSVSVHSNLAVVGFEDGNIRFFSIDKLKNLGKAKISEGKITYLTISPVGWVIFVGDSLSNLYLVAIENLEPLSVKTQKIKSLDNSEITNVSVQQKTKKNRFLAASASGLIKVWEKSEKVAVSPSKKLEDPFNMTKDWVFTEVDSFSIKEILGKDITKTFAQFSLLHDSQIICCSENASEIIMRDFVRNSLVKRVAISNPPTAFGIIGNKDHVILGNEDGTVELVDLKNSKINKARIHGGKIESLSTMADGESKTIVTGSYAEIIKWTISL